MALKVAPMEAVTLIHKLPAGIFTRRQEDQRILREGLKHGNDR